MAFRNAPKLAITSIAAEPRLLKDSEATNIHVRKVIGALHTKMHPEGTLAFVVPVAASNAATCPTRGVCTLTAYMVS